MSEPGLYVHVPFCLSKCPYCDFYSITTPERVRDYLNALDRECELRAGFLQPFDTLYLGGGTPSCLNEGELERLLGILRARFRFTSDLELTIEANPGDLTPEKVWHFKALGVNRLSLGVQALDDRVLTCLGRRHSADEARFAIELARAAGFANLGLDFIHDVPGQDLAGFLQGLEEALSYAPEHLSCYALTIAEKTPFGAMRTSGELVPVSEGEAAAIYRETSALLRARGYQHYEISNYARTPAWRSRHNQKYWLRAPTLGLGPAAHSFDGCVRWSNVASVETYVERLTAGAEPVAVRETLSAEQAQLETIALGLRWVEGIALADVPDRPEAQRLIARWIADGLAVKDDDRLRPTPAGFLVADGMARELA